MQDQVESASMLGKRIYMVLGLSRCLPYFWLQGKSTGLNVGKFVGIFSAPTWILSYTEASSRKLKTVGNAFCLPHPYSMTMILSACLVFLL